jgi:hypothetical protein
LARCFASSASAARVINPSVSGPNIPVYSPSLWDNLPFNRSKMPRIPLSEGFPNLPKVNETVAVPVKEEVTISTLSNGLRVASLPSSSPIASVGVFVDAGSRYESVDNNGISHFLELMSLKSTHNRSDFRLVREMLKMVI